MFPMNVSWNNGPRICTINIFAVCEASELVHFRKRIGESGTKLIFKESIRINGDNSHDEHVNADTIVLEKNITFPTDGKLHKKIIKKTLRNVHHEHCPSGRATSGGLKSQALINAFETIPKTNRKPEKPIRK